MTPIRIEGIRKTYGAAVAVADVSLSIDAGELFFLLGPSGCGKTTLLRILAGFVEPDAGEVYFGTQRITGLPPRARDAGMVFQTYALWPHLTVAENVAYGLRVRGVSRAEIATRVDRVLKMVRMEDYRERRPNQLSGGQQQRVALARALVIEPRVLLLDEPLSNLDARLRDEMRDEIRRLHRETGLTMVYVTHDQKEALTLADRLAVMSAGRLEQVGTPLEVYQRPVTAFVAGFLGDANFIPGKLVSVDAGHCTVNTPLGPLIASRNNDLPEKGSPVQCMIRPQSLSLASDESPAPNRVAATVERSTFLGELLQWQVIAAGGTKLLVMLLPHTTAKVQVGDPITLSARPAEVVVLKQ
jgi:iron(III) transport system ATP-binding protein